MKIKALLNTEVQAFIQKNLNENLTKLLLKKNPFNTIELSEIANQIKGKKTALKKWPFLVKEGILYPPHLNLEQASSELTAEFKSQFYSGNHFVDLTSGFGIDAYFLSKKFENRHLVEQNPELIEIVAHNWAILGQKAEFHHSTLENFLEKTQPHFQLIYIDPARRDENLRKKVFLEDLSPNIIDLEEKLLDISDTVLIKLSPMMDISALQNQLNSIFRIDIVSVKNEVKELLVHLKKGANNINYPIFCHNLATDEPTFEISMKDQKKIDYSDVQNYIQIPNASLMKMGKFDSLSHRYKLKKLHPNSHIFTSETWVDQFPGRQFKVKVIGKNDIKPQSKYNLIIRNYPLSDSEIKKKYRIIDGGNEYLIFTQSQNKKIILKTC